MGHKSGEKVGSSYCHGLGGNQVFAYTKRQQIMSDDNCLDASNANGPVNLVRCHGMGGNQEWSFDENVSWEYLKLNKNLWISLIFPRIDWSSTSTPETVLPDPPRTIRRLHFFGPVTTPKASSGSCSQSSSGSQSTARWTKSADRTCWSLPTWTKSIVIRCKLFPFFIPTTFFR